MKKTGMILTRLMCIMMVFGLLCHGVEIRAEEAASAQIEQIQLEKDSCVLYVNHNQGEEWQVTPENSTLVVDGEECAITGISSVKKEEMPISYVMMIDISGSMDKERMDAIKDIINQFVDGKGEADNFCITTMGNHLSSSDVLQNPDEIRAYMEQITVTKEDTNLYQSIKDEISMMRTFENLHTKKCLIVFSDGAEDQKTGITREEAEASVKEANIPVFTIAMLKQNPSQAQTEGAKILGSFARYSAGGAHYAPVLEGYDNSEIYGRIQGILKNSLLVSTQIQGANITEDTVDISLTLSDGTLAAAAQYKLSGNVLKQIKLLQEDMETTELTEDSEITGEAQGGSLSMPLVIGIVAAMLVVLVIIIVRKSKQKMSADDVVYMKKADIQLVRINAENEQHEFTIKEEIKVGRGRRCQLCLEDAALSEVHCSLHWKQGELFIKDENSTNGTYVNGVPIIGEYKLEQGDVILIGSSEFQINWR